MNKDDEIKIKTILKSNLVNISTPNYGLTINQVLKNKLIALKDWQFVKDYFDVTAALGGIRFPWIGSTAVHLPIKPAVFDEQKLNLSKVTYADGYLKCSQKIVTPLATLQDLGDSQEYKNQIKILVENSEKTFKRVFSADVLCLFYYERMGIPKILGAMLDDFATKGNYPIDSKEDAVNILDNMVVLTKAGESSSVRDRDSSYRRCLGWTSDVGRKLDIETATNTGFNNSFTKLIQYTLEYYKEKRLAVVFQGVNTPAAPSAATLTTIKETITLLQQALLPFDYGRNHIITTTGIAWFIVAMDLFSKLKGAFGIPPNYTEPAQYIPALYALLVEGKSVSNSDTNRYIVNKQCAENGRDILLAVQGLDINIVSDDDLQLWLTLMETKIEAYRTAYRGLTGVDLGAPGTPKIEQQV